MSFDIPIMGDASELEEEVSDTNIDEVTTDETSSEYNDTLTEIEELRSKRKTILEKLHEYEVQIAHILDVNIDRLELNVVKNTITIDVARNRKVIFTHSDLTKLIDLFGVKDIAISTPIRCKILLHLLNETTVSSTGDDDDIYKDNDQDIEENLVDKLEYKPHKHQYDW